MWLCKASRAGPGPLAVFATRLCVSWPALERYGSGDLPAPSVGKLYMPGRAARGGGVAAASHTDLRRHFANFLVSKSWLERADLWRIAIDHLVSVLLRRSSQVKIDQV